MLEQQQRVLCSLLFVLCVAIKGVKGKELCKAVYEQVYFLTWHRLLYVERDYCDLLFGAYHLHIGVTFGGDSVESLEKSMDA